jgi:hypothetical protein
VKPGFPSENATPWRDQVHIHSAPPSRREQDHRSFAACHRSPDEGPQKLGFVPISFPS